MKSKFSLLGILAALVIGLTAVFIGCTKEDVNAVVKYYGKVVYINTSTPFPDLEVKVTDGENTHCQVHTDANGMFSLLVKVDEINGNYYVLVGDSTCAPKKVQIPGYGQPEINLGTIDVEGPTPPTVETAEVTSFSGTTAIAGGNVTFDGRVSVTARGVCYSTKPYPTLDDKVVAAGNGTGQFTCKLENLTQQTAYYVRAYAINREGTSFGDQIAFVTTEGKAVVLTKPADDITFESALLSGEITDDGGYEVDDYGLCWGEHMTPTIEDTHHSCKGQTDFAYTVTGLKKKTTYYARAYAHNSMGLSYGNEIMFTTVDGLPEVSTASVTEIHSVSAVCGGTVKSDGGYPVSARGVCWSSTSATPTIKDNHTTDGSGLGVFISQLTDLTAETTYYVRAYATNEAGTAYGEQMQFYTIDGLPVVSTAEVSNIKGTTAVCGGTISDDGGYSITARGVCWSTTSAAPTLEDQHTTDGVGMGTFISQLENLKETTSYYVRAYAKNKTGTSFGKSVYFTTITDPKSAAVSTLPATNITSSEATLCGKVTNEGYPQYTERGFCYNSSGMPTVYDNKVSVQGTGTGNYTCRINIDVQDYYYRAYVIQNGQVIYGEQEFFTPDLAGPTLFIGNVTEIGSSSAKVSATISTAGEPAYSKRGFCYGKYTDPKIENGNCQYIEESASLAEAYEMTLPNLTSNTIYYVCAYVEWLGHRIYSNTRSFQTAEDISVMIQNELLSPQCVVNNSTVTWSGMLLGGTSTSVSYVSLGFVYDKKSNPTVGNGTAMQVAYTGTQTENNVLGFYSTVSGLESGVIYYVRAYVQMSYGYVYSDQITIQMNPTDPVIQTYAVSNLEALTSGYWKAQFQGVFYTDGTPPALDWGFIYSTKTNPTADDPSAIVVSRQQHVAVPNSTNYVFATNVTGLQANQIYYVRAFARTSIGYTYGGVLSFSTY